MPPLTAAQRASGTGAAQQLVQAPAACDARHGECWGQQGWAGLGWVPEASRTAHSRAGVLGQYRALPAQQPSPHATLASFRSKAACSGCGCETTAATPSGWPAPTHCTASCAPGAGEGQGGSTDGAPGDMAGRAPLLVGAGEQFASEPSAAPCLHSQLRLPPAGACAFAPSCSARGACLPQCPLHLVAGPKEQCPRGAGCPLVSSGCGCCTALLYCFSVRTVASRTSLRCS